MPRIIDAFTQFLDNDGSPLSNGWLLFLVSGTTSTHKDTFSDPLETTPNTNPVQLDGAGRCPSIWGQGSYRVISYTNDPIISSPEVQIELFDPVGGSVGTGEFEPWNGESSFNKGQLVTGDDGAYYRSLVTENQGNNPVTDITGNWEKFEFVYFYTQYRAYSIGDIVRTTSGRFYVSLIDTNLSNEPSSHPLAWRDYDIPAWNVIIEAGIASSNSYYAFDTTIAVFTFDLPSAPIDGEFVEFKEFTGMASTNEFTVGRNGKTIMGLSEDMNVKTDNVTLRLTFFADTDDWRL